MAEEDCLAVGSAAGRVYAVYGGVYVSVALVWLWLVDGVRPHVWDFVGVAVTLLGMSIIMFAPRAGFEVGTDQFDSRFGNRTGIRKPDSKLLRFDARGENRFSGRVVGKWLCEMTSAFIVKELRGARALRLICDRSAFPPPFEKDALPIR
jgi:hypothetical protein